MYNCSMDSHQLLPLLPGDEQPLDIEACVARVKASGT